MNVLWHKIGADLWGNKSRSTIVILSLAVGVFALGSVFGMVDLLLRNMDQAHQAVQPSHLNIILRGTIAQSEVDNLMKIKGVDGIDPVNQLTIRYKRNPREDWELGSLVMRDDYREQSYDIMELKKGSWPRNEQIGIERLSSQFLNISPKDKVILSVKGIEKTCVINGLIRHPFIKPPQFGGQVHFFIDAEGFENFTGIPRGQYAQLLVRISPYSYSKARAIESKIRTKLSERGGDIALTLYQDPNKHWGRKFGEGVTLIMRIIAIITLILSTVLVMTMMSAVINQQINQIGILKSLGGSTKTIIFFYSSMVFALSTMACILSVPAAIYFSHEMTKWFLNLFNIDYEGIEISPLAVILQAFASLITPLLAALGPVLKGARITVREALSNYGLGGDFGFRRIDRIIESIGSLLLPTVYASALGNMFRRKGRLILTLTVLIIAGTLFLVVMSLTSSIQKTLDNDVARRNYDYTIGFLKMQKLSKVESILIDLQQVESYELWYRRNAFLSDPFETSLLSKGHNVQLLGLPRSSKLYRPIIISGNWIDQKQGQVIVISADLAQANNVKIGDRLSIDLGGVTQPNWEVIGTYRTIMSSGFALEPIYAPLKSVREVFGGNNEGTQLYLTTSENEIERIESQSKKIQSLFEEQGIDIDLYATTIVEENRQSTEKQFNTVINLFLILATLIAIVGGIGLMGALSIAVVERRREIGVMRSIGASSVKIMSIFVMEALFQGLLSWFLAVPLAFLCAEPLASLLGQKMLDVDLDYEFHLGAVLLWLFLVIFLSFLASVLPSLKAIRISIRESLNYQ